MVSGGTRHRRDGGAVRTEATGWIWKYAATASSKPAEARNATPNPFPAIDGGLSHHGTPQLETYQYPFRPTKDNATTPITAAANNALLRRDRRTLGATATAATTASEPARPA